MRYALTYGAISGAIVVGVLCLGFVVDLNHSHSLWFGYLVMLVALSMIFIGMKRYRDVEKGGVVRFFPAFGLGIMTAIVSGLFYVVGWEFYLAMSYAQASDFIVQMGASQIQHMREAGATAAAIASAQAEIDWGIDIYRNPPARFAITFVEIFPVGFLVALISAAILRNPRILPARQAA